MLFKDLWDCLYNAHHAIKSGSLEKQDETINALFRFLDNRRNQQFPSLLCEQAIQISSWYLERVLPALEYEEQDRQDIARHYEEFLEHLKACGTASQKIEKAFERLIEQIRNGTFIRVHEVAEALSEIVRDFFHLQDLQGFQNPFRSDHQFQQRLQSLRDNFRYDQAAAFFKDFFDVFLKDSNSSSSCRLAIHNFTNMFEYILDSYFHAKAVLVDPFRHGQIMPLWVTVDADKTSEHVEFWNQNIDPTMQESADIARDIARQYLMNEYERNVPEKIFVQCQFPHFDVSFKDTSASLLLGIRIVEEVLGVKSKPATVITGGVGRTG